MQTAGWLKILADSWRFTHRDKKSPAEEPPMIYHKGGTKTLDVHGPVIHHILIPPFKANIRINEPCSKPFLDLNAISRPYACTLRNTYAIHLMCYHRKKSHKTNTSWDLFWGKPRNSNLKKPCDTTANDDGDQHPRPPQLGHRDLMPWGLFRGIYMLHIPSAPWDGYIYLQKKYHKINLSRIGIYIPGNSMDFMGCEVIHSWMFNSSLLKKQGRKPKGDSSSNSHFSGASC